MRSEDGGACSTIGIMSETRAGTGSSPPAKTFLAPTYEGDFVLDEPLALECGRALAG